MTDRLSMDGAAFEAFRKRGRSGVLTGATVTFLLVTVLVIVAWAALNWSNLTTLIASYQSFIRDAEHMTDPTPEQIWPLISKLIALQASALALQGAIYLARAAYEAACLRWMIRGETGGLFGLTLGADTWRVVVCYLLWYVLLMALTIACTLVCVLTFVAIGVASGAGQDPQNAVAGLVIAAPLMMLAVLALLVIFGVRLAPMAATAVGTRSWNYFDAWKVTRGKFWSLLGAFLIVVAIFAAVSVVLQTVFGVTILAGLIGHIAGLGEGATPEQVFAMLTAPEISIPIAVFAALMGVIGTIFYMAFAGVNARAVQVALAEGRIAVAA